MKKIILLSLTIFPFLLSPLSFAQYEECGGDFNCYYEIKAKIEQERQVEEELEEERFRRQQLKLEERQLEEVEEQTEILEQQVEEDQYTMPPVEAQ